MTVSGARDRDRRPRASAYEAARGPRGSGPRGAVASTHFPSRHAPCDNSKSTSEPVSGHYIPGAHGASRRVL